MNAHALLLRFDVDVGEHRFAQAFVDNLPVVSDYFSSNPAKPCGDV